MSKGEVEQPVQGCMDNVCDLGTNPGLPETHP